MEYEVVTKAPFAVIGKEGSTQQGPGFVQALWAEANGHFEEVAHLAKRAPDGSLVGIWGAMTDFSRSFRPWADGFSKGLYLAGVECAEDAAPPETWQKWCVPGFTFLKVKCESDDTFQKGLALLEEKGLPLAGAIQDFTDPKTGENYMCFPIK